MESIKAYVICLENAKKERCEANFEKNKKVIKNLEWFNAVDGYSLNLQDKRIHPNVRFHIKYDHATDHEHIRTLGEVGCALSHINLWKKCVKLNEPILVMEDDILLEGNMVNLIKESFVKIPKDAEFASLISGMYLINRPGPDDTKIVNGWKRIGANFTGMLLYYITPEGAKKLLEYALPVISPIDIYIGYYSYTNPNFKSYRTEKKINFNNGKTTINRMFNFKMALPDSNTFYIMVLVVMPLFLLSIIISLIIPV